MTQIHLTITDRQLLLLSASPLPAGNVDTVSLCVEPDHTWLGLHLRAHLTLAEQPHLCAVLPLDGSGSCLLPPLLTAAPGTLLCAIEGVGEYPDTRRKTTTTVPYRLLPTAQADPSAAIANVADATATPAQVLAGATFYAGDAAPQTGTVESYEPGDVVAPTPVLDAVTVAADFSEGDQTVTPAGGALMRSLTVTAPATLTAENIAQGVTVAGITGTLPTLPDVTPADEGKLLTVSPAGTWSAAEAPVPLPDVTPADEGKLLTVSPAGTWSAAEAPVPLPDVTPADEGKLLTVSPAGTWSAAEAPSSLPPAAASDQDHFLTVGSDGSWQRSAATVNELIDAYLGDALGGDY